MSTIMYASAISSVKAVTGPRRSVVRASSAGSKAPKAVKAAAAVTRRDTLALGVSAVQLMVASKAWALIPGNDDEDEELLARAKDRRSEKIQAERALEKTYVTKNNLKLDQDTSKVQIAIFKLSKSDGLIEQGYLALANEELTKGTWESDLAAFGKDEAWLKTDPAAFLAAVADLKKECAAGDKERAKKAYVKAAKALESFAKDSKTAESLKLL